MTAPRRTTAGRPTERMRLLRRLHVAVLIVAGLALAAAIFSHERLATVLLVATVIALAISAELLRFIAHHREEHP